MPIKHLDNRDLISRDLVEIKMKIIKMVNVGL